MNGPLCLRQFVGFTVIRQKHLWAGKRSKGLGLGISLLSISWISNIGESLEVLTQSTRRALIC